MQLTVNLSHASRLMMRPYLDVFNHLQLLLGVIIEEAGSASLVHIDALPFSLQSLLYRSDVLNLLSINKGPFSEREMKS